MADLRLQGVAALPAGGAGAALYPLHANAQSLTNFLNGEYRPDTHQGRRNGWGIRRGNTGMTLNDTERQRALTGRTVRGEFQPLRAGSESWRLHP